MIRDTEVHVFRGAESICEPHEITKVTLSWTGPTDPGVAEELERLIAEGRLPETDGFWRVTPDVEEPEA